MDYIKGEVLTMEINEETHVGHVFIYAVPRKGEYIWFSEEKKGHRSWLVEDVAYHVGHGNLEGYREGYQSVVIYATPANKK